MARAPLTLRFQISLVLLLSALNGIVLLAAVVSLLTGPRPDPETLLIETVALLVWVLVITAVTVWSAFRVRSMLSQPLFELAGRATQVADGHLSEPFPEPQGGVEIQALGQAMEAMRSSLMRSRDQAAEQAQVVTTMLNALDNGVVLLDSKHRVVDYNPRAAQAYRLLTKESIKRQHSLQALVSEADFGPVTTRLNVDAMDSTSAMRHYLLSIKPLRSQGHVLVLHDVTERTRLDALQREFLSVVTHELKTPLTSIQGYIRLLLMGKGGTLTDKQRELLSRSSGQAGVLYEMVQDLLDATRLEGGQLQLDLSPVTVTECVEEMRAHFQGTAIAAGLTLEASHRLSPSLRVNADPMRLQQILGNLVRNAIKFTDSGGVSVHAEVCGAELAISVRDTGRGIPPEALTRLFEKFYQVERGDKRRSGGAGLGLYICQQLAHAMDGRMEVRSTVGQGSTFTLLLPIPPTDSPPL